MNHLYNTQPKRFECRASFFFSNFKKIWISRHISNNKYHPTSCVFEEGKMIFKRKKKHFCHCNNINTFFVILATLVILGTVKKDVSWQLYIWYSCYVLKVCKQWVVKKLKLWPICKRRHINVTLRMGIEWYQKDWGLERIKSWYGTSGSRLNVKGSSDVEPVQVIKHQTSSVSILFVRKNRILC